MSSIDRLRLQDGGRNEPSGSRRRAGLNRTVGRDSLLFSSRAECPALFECRQSP